MAKVSLDPKTVIAEIVAANARLPLAAERLSKELGQRISTADLMRAVVDDQAGMTEQLRAQLVLQLFNTLMETQVAFQASIADLSPDAVARAYAAQVTAFAAITAKPLEQATEQPVSFIDARERLLNKLDEHQRRRDEANEVRETSG